MENENSNNEVWYKKKRYIIPLAVLGLVFVLNSDTTNQKKPEAAITPAYQYSNSTYQPINHAGSIVAPILNPKPAVNVQNSLSNDNYYTNVNGNTVHSPAYSNSGSVQSGASARCGDGTYSFSQNRRGTCSHHGGVSSWLY